MAKADYRIQGKIEADLLKQIPEGMELTVYAVRDRKVISSARVSEDGNFSIEYEYDAYESERRAIPTGTYLIAGPAVPSDMPDDAIIGRKFPKVFMGSEAFKEEEGTFYAEVGPEAAAELCVVRRFVDFFEEHCRVWNPCIKVEVCSRIENGVCYDERDLENARVRIYAVRQSLIALMGTTPQPYTELIAEGDTDSSGRFWHSETICWYTYMVSMTHTLGYRVEIGQIIDGAFHSIYIDPEDELRHLQSGVCEEIYIDESDVVCPSEPEGLLPGSNFKFTRIGNIPVGYIQQSETSPFYGYADSHAAMDSATLKVYDSAFGRTIKLFANIGSALLSGTNEVRYYRIAYSYDSNGTTSQEYIRTPFRNLREATIAEMPTTGPYVTENMGPILGPDSERNVYNYPNPYDTTVDWVYKGLVMVLNTYTLPMHYGKFTFTIEPLNASMNPVAVANPGDLSFTIVVDNTAPSASIGDIGGPYGQAPACGFLELDGDNTYTACDGNTRKQLSGTVTVPYTATDAHQNIYRIRVIADYGDVCDRDIVMQTLNYTDTSVVPVTSRPHWGGGSYSASSQGKQHTTDVHGIPIVGSKLNRWDQCAYQFRVRIHKRVTNGEVAYYWWDFTKHITIMEK